jgi:hypothetical protein
MVLEIPK